MSNGFGAKSTALSLTALFSMIAVPSVCASARAAAVDLQLDAVPTGGQAQAKALDSLQKAIERATHGRVRLTVRIGRDNLTTASLVENLMFDDTDMLSGDLSNYLPLMIDEVSGLSTPFLIPSADAARAYISSPLMDEARRKVLVSRHIRFLEMNAVRQPFHIMVAKRPIWGPADLKGLKLTTLMPITKIAAGLWQDLGAMYVAPLPPAELVAAIKDGRIDAVLFPDLESARDSQLDLAGLSWTAIDDCPAIWEISVNDTSWEKLTAEDQALVGDAARVAAATFQKFADAEIKHQQRRHAHPIATFDAVAARRQLGPAYRALTNRGLMNPKVVATADMVLSPPLSPSR